MAFQRAGLTVCARALRRAGPLTRMARLSPTSPGSYAAVREFNVRLELSLGSAQCAWPRGKSKGRKWLLTAKLPS